MIPYYSVIIFAALILLFVLPARNKFIYDKILRKKRGRRIRMTIDMITELIGKDVIITCFNESFAKPALIACRE